MAFEIVGKLHEVYPEQQVTEKFKKREFVLEIQDGMYQQYIKFQLTQDRCSALENFAKGEEMKVSFNLTGRPGNSKDGSTVYYTNLVAWRLEKGSAPVKTAPDMRTEPISDIDDIPF